MLVQCFTMKSSQETKILVKLLIATVVPSTNDYTKEKEGELKRIQHCVGWIREEISSSIQFPYFIKRSMGYH